MRHSGAGRRHSAVACPEQKAGDGSAHERIAEFFNTIVRRFDGTQQPIVRGRKPLELYISRSGAVTPGSEPALVLGDAIPVDSSESLLLLRVESLQLVIGELLFELFATTPDCVVHASDFGQQRVTLSPTLCQFVIWRSATGKALEARDLRSQLLDVLNQQPFLFIVGSFRGYPLGGLPRGDLLLYLLPVRR